MKKLLLLFLLIKSSLWGQGGFIVQTANGKVEGYVKENLRIFKGIPFAAPPIDEFRWKAPQPAANWVGVKETKKFG